MPLLDSDGETLFANGGNVFLDIDDDSVHVVAGSACIQEKQLHMMVKASFLHFFLVVRVLLKSRP